MRLSSLLALIPLAACGSNGISGVWTIEVPSTSEDECEDNVTFTYDGATVVENADPDAVPGVLIEETSDSSPSLIVVAIEQSSSTSATLLVGNEIYPGTKTENEWTFTWERTTDSSVTESVANYAYSLDVKSVSTTTWTLSAEGDVLSGSAEASSDATREWTESDLWNEEAQAYYDRSQIPAATYLTVSRQGTSAPASNSFDKEDCGGTQCELKVVSKCSGSLDLSGARTGYETEDMADKVIVSGQAGGSI